MMVKKILGSEAKKGYVKPLLTRNEPLVDITFTSGGAITGTGGNPGTFTGGKPSLGRPAVGSSPMGGTLASGPMEMPDEIGGGNDGGAGTIIGGGTVVPGTGGAPGTVL